MLTRGLVLLFIVSSLLLHDCRVFGEPMVSFCENAKKGEWKAMLPNVLLEIPFAADEIRCSNVDSTQYAVTIQYSSYETEVVSESSKEKIDTFVSKVISKIASEYIITVEGAIDLNDEEAVFAYVPKPESKDHSKFLQSIIHPILPKSFKVYQSFDKKGLPRDVQSHIKDNKIHVWIVTNGIWSHVLLPRDDKDTAHPDELLRHLVKVFNRLQFPLKVAYQSLETYSLYKGEGFNMFVIYHHGDQLDEVHNTIVDPLLNFFRPFFVFITYDIDKHPIPAHVNANGPFPYIVTFNKKQKSGVHINSQFTPYTFDRLKSILESIIDPAVINQEASNQRGLVLTHIDAKTLEAVSANDRTPAIAAVCDENSPSCHILEEKMSKAMLAIHKLNEDYEIALYLVRCKSPKDITFSDVPRLPYVLIRDEEGHWSLFSDTASVTMFIKAIQDHGSIRDTSDDDNYSTDYPIDGPVYESEEDYYSSFKELEEDDPVGLKFSKYYAVPHILPILTTDNYTEFVEQNEACLIAFYLPYCFQCRPMIYHLLNSTNQLKEAGMSPAITNCANYPDVCEAFDVFRYPTVLYRRHFNDAWNSFNGILSDKELIKLALNKDDTGDRSPVVELNPSELLHILKGNGLTTLLILVSPDLPSYIENGVSSLVKSGQMYWLNSIRYTKLGGFLTGQNYLEEPVLVFADYIKRSLYRLTLDDSSSPDIVRKFVNDVTNGNREPDGDINHNDWKPLSEPIEFPSSSFLAIKDGTYDNNDNDEEIVSTDSSMEEENVFDHSIDMDHHGRHEEL